MLRRTYETAVSPDRPADAHLLAAFMAYIRLEQVSRMNHTVDRSRTVDIFRSSALDTRQEYSSAFDGGPNVVWRGTAWKAFIHGLGS